MTLEFATSILFRDIIQMVRLAVNQKLMQHKWLTVVFQCINNISSIKLYVANLHVCCEGELRLGGIVTYTSESRWLRLLAYIEPQFTIC